MMTIMAVYLSIMICLPYTCAWRENNNDYLDNPIYEHFSLEPKYWEEATVYMNLTHQPQSSTARYKIEEREWIVQALKDVAFLLRGHKFGDFDRRIYTADFRNDSVKLFYRQFPTPPLRNLHQKVRHVCGESLIDCVTYLQKVAHHTQFSRLDFPGTMTFDELKNTTVNNTEMATAEEHCLLRQRSDNRNALPFRGLLDRFQWRTTASYYMCFFTIGHSDEIRRLHEPCDNYAGCLDPVYGVHNKDPRANDSIPYSCAMYSFCPDPCCPKHITSYEKCWNDESNPCYDVAPPDARECKMNPRDNRDFNEMVKNHWNLTCNCTEKGYIFRSMFGMCIDIDECLLGRHSCNNETQSCFNLPGGFICGCHWGYFYDRVTNRCIQHLFANPMRIQSRMPPTEVSYVQKIFSILHPGAFRRHQESKEHKSKLIYNSP